ncbi:MAG: 30S ribosomal protein S15 [Candidatus Woesearchaeota archaeon]
MARMYSRAKGVSGSTKPIKRVVPGWLKYTAKEAELLVVKYAKEDKKPSQIGILLRDQYGIPDIKLVTGKSVKQILDEKKIKQELPEDFLALIKRSVMLRKHLEENKKDMSAKRGLQLTDSKIRRLAKFYKRKGILEAKWRYNADQFKMYAQD